MAVLSTDFSEPFMRQAAGRLQGVILVPPTGGIASVTPTIGEPNAIVSRALEQFAIFEGRLAAHGVRALKLEATPEWPLGVLCADCAVMFPSGAFLMRPSDLRRRGEVAAVAAALGRARIPIVGHIEAPGLLDGGDVLLSADSVYLGVSVKRQAEIGIPAALHGNSLGREQLAAYARTKNYKVFDVPIAAEVRRLRSVASFVDEQTMLFASGLVDGSAFDRLEKIAVPRGEDYGAGVLALGRRRVLANLRFRETIPLLRKAKIAVDAIDLWEFGKIGATPSSMALAIKRD